MSSDIPRVLSVQSHVVHGYVGNKSATFPLQLLGFEVDPLNSVHFSNHSGYNRKAGQILTEKDLDDLTECLHENNLDYYTHLLTGYIGAESFLNRIAELVKHLRTVNPSLIYVCDPVMGDNGRMYVPEALLPVYRNKIVALADIVTPNQFELELLTEMKVNSLDDAWKAIDILHKKGPKTVVISSSELGDADNLVALASSRQNNKQQYAIIKIARLPASFTGTGDLFAALMLAWMHKTSGNLKESLEKTVATLQSVLKRTWQSAQGKERPKFIELKILQSKADIENPNVTVFATTSK